MKQKIYIAGKVTGEPIAQCTTKFEKAQVAIEKLGHEAINPLVVVNDWACPWDLAMRKCIAAMMQCDAVLSLQDCNSSPGATLELKLAHKLRMPIFYEIEHFTKFSKSELWKEPIPSR